MGKRIISGVLCALLLLSTLLPVRAEEAVCKISTVEEFLTFAENCRLDSYSRDLTVYLEANLDLTGVAFAGIPVFSGTFEGGRYTISGLSLTAEGSVQGLFRYLTADAVVRNLTVEGEIHPGGSRGKVGAIAGENAGQIISCSFSGSVSGGDAVGGLAGRNTVTGVIENSSAVGQIQGDHFVGGIAGENYGVIRSCTNNAMINTTPQQNSVELQDITMDTLANTEAANTVTDIGGIAGISTGVIRECRNSGDVGYRHMGYNIGGVAGTSSGYIGSCFNHGSIQGRKEVGGIVGQMEPATVITFSQDTLQILEGQLDTMSGLVSRASGNAYANAEQVGSHIGALQQQANSARDAVNALLPSENMDPDRIIAAQNSLSDALSAMPGSLQGAASAAQNTASGLIRDLQAVSGQIGAMGETIHSASENLGGSITDVSDQDTPEQLTGKVDGCYSNGDVLGDLNVGGIAGAIAMENDLDVLQDWEQRGEESLNFQSEIRAVILGCRNTGMITGKKQNAGGIAGWQSLGLIKGCTNTGKIDGTDGDYVGGIAGLSTGYIRENNAKCTLLVGAFGGGIAGSGTVVTDCMSMVQLQGGRENIGAILGEATENTLAEAENPIAGNFYPVFEQDVGAIDGISFAGMAEPMALDAFLAREDLPSVFTSMLLRFLLPDGKETCVTVQTGDTLSPERIPQIPTRDGQEARWEGLEAAENAPILSDMTFTAVYTSYSTVIQSEQTRENGLPILLAEGTFTDEGAIALVEAGTEELPVSESDTPLEAWDVQITGPAATIRYRIPEHAEAEHLVLLTCDGEGKWRETACTLDGSYLVFAMEGDMRKIALTEREPDNRLMWIAVFISAALIVLVGVLVWVKKRHVRKKAKTQ